MAVYAEAELRKHIRDLEIGDKFITKSRVISRTDIEHFAIATGDPAPAFISDEHARAAGWKKQLAPGLLSYSIAVGLMYQSGLLVDAVYMATDKMRFHKPVYPDDSIHVEAEVLARKQTSSGRMLCTYRWVIKNQDNQATAEGENT